MNDEDLIGQREVGGDYDADDVIDETNALTLQKVKRKVCAEELELLKRDLEKEEGASDGAGQ